MIQIEERMDLAHLEQAYNLMENLKIKQKKEFIVN